jgi:hypothetical protein
MKYAPLLMSLALLLAFAPAPVRAEVTAENPVAYATSEKQKNGAIFLTLKNTGEAADTLTGAATDIAGRTELHETSTAPNAAGMDVSTMRPVETLAIAPAASVAFEPMGKHIMLIGLKKQLVAGESFPLTLHFEKAGDVTTNVKIVDRSYQLGTDAAEPKP